ncbi:hypothetical protein D3C76_1590020 [compost metagenome]
MDINGNIVFAGLERAEDQRRHPAALFHHDADRKRVAVQRAQVMGDMLREAPQLLVAVTLFFATHRQRIRLPACQVMNLLDQRPTRALRRIACEL